MTFVKIIKEFPNTNNFHEGDVVDIPSPEKLIKLGYVEETSQPVSPVEEVSPVSEPVVKKKKTKKFW